MQRIITTVASALILSACTTAEFTDVPRQSELVREPPIGEVREAAVGDTLVKTAKVTEIPAIYLREEVLAKGTGIAAGSRVKISPGKLPLTFVDGENECFVSPETVEVSNFMTRDTLPEGSGGVCINKRNPDFVRVLTNAGAANLWYDPTEEIQFERTSYIDVEAPGFWQELIYNGKSGSTVKFVYREFGNQLARPAFDQDVEYDLNEGSEIGFKRARLDIVEATNTYIRYKVLAHFPPPSMP